MSLQSTKLMNLADGQVLYNDLRKREDLKAEVIEGTTQTISFDSSGNVSQIVHKDGSNNTVRTDVFTFEDGTITEVRTLAGGESLTIVTDTNTLVTTVIFTAGI